MKTDEVDVYENFDDLNLKENLLRGIYSMGFEKPSAIQQKGIMPIINGQDVIAQAQSGTGKTATFSIGLLERIDETKNETQAVVLAHTRELALQIESVIINFALFCNPMNSRYPTGGMVIILLFKLILFSSIIFFVLG